MSLTFIFSPEALKSHSPTTTLVPSLVILPVGAVLARLMDKEPELIVNILAAAAMVTDAQLPAL